MDAWGWDELQPWLELRVGFRRSSALCPQRPDAGRQWSSAAARAELRRTAVVAGVRRRFAPHQLRHAHAVEMAREGVPLVVIQRQLGHSNLGITSVYLQGIANAEIIDTVHGRRAPMIPSAHHFGSDHIAALLVAQSGAFTRERHSPLSSGDGRVEATEAPVYGTAESITGVMRQPPDARTETSPAPLPSDPDQPNKRLSQKMAPLLTFPGVAAIAHGSMYPNDSNAPAKPPWLE